MIFDKCEEILGHQPDMGSLANGLMTNCKMNCDWLAGLLALQTLLLLIILLMATYNSI